MTNQINTSRIKEKVPIGIIMKREDTVLDVVATGQNIKRIMCERGYTVKDVQTHLKLSTSQSIYHWFDGKSMPTVDNLYALSDLFCIPVDAMLKGNRKYRLVLCWDDRCTRIYVYY